MFVIDASAALACLLFDDAADRDLTPILSRLSEQGAIVPAMFMPEILHALVKRERTTRGISTLFDEQIAAIHAMPLIIDPWTAFYLETATLALARTHRLSIYDAAYLELAIRESLPLATFDKALIRAAGAMQVPLVA